MQSSRRCGSLPLLVAAALTAWLGACSAGPRLDDVESLELIERFPVAYSGELTSERDRDWASGAGELWTRAGDGPAGGRFEDADGTVAQFQVSTRMLSMAPEVASRFLGFDRLPALAGGTPAGGELATEDLDRLVGNLVSSGLASELDSPSLVVSDGIPGRFDAVSRVPFVEGFQLAVDGARFMADPRVEEARSGLQMLLRVDDRQDGEVDCHIELHTAELVGGLHEVESGLPGGGRLALQVPVFLLQELEADASVGAGHALVVTGLQLPTSSEVLVVIVEPARARS